MSIKLDVTIPLSVPVAILRDGVAKTVTSLVLSRPKTRHIKRLAAIAGADLLGALLGDTRSQGEQVDLTKLAGDVLPKLFSAERLDATEALLADLLGISADEFGEIDPMDLPAIGKGFLDFFPALQSIASRSSPQT